MKLGLLPYKIVKTLKLSEVIDEELFSIADFGLPHGVCPGIRMIKREGVG
jgi:hypothetical protein